MYFIMGKNRRGEDALVLGASLVEADRKSREAGMSECQQILLTFLQQKLEGMTVILYHGGEVRELTFSIKCDVLKILAGKETTRRFHLLDERRHETQDDD